MAHDECIGPWIKSVRVSEITGDAVVDPGIFRIFENAEGNLTGEHIVDAQLTPLTNVRCTPEGQHKRISFTRSLESALIVYRGKVVSNGEDHIILRGKYDLITINGQTLDDMTFTAGDSGDWSSEKPGV